MDCSFLQINIKDFLIYIFSKEFIAYYIMHLYRVKCLNLYIKCRKKVVYKYRQVILNFNEGGLVLYYV